MSWLDNVLLFIILSLKKAYERNNVEYLSKNIGERLIISWISCT